MREVHEGISQSGQRGLFDNGGYLVWPLDNDESAELAAYRNGWKLVS